MSVGQFESPSARTVVQLLGDTLLFVVFEIICVSFVK